MVQVVKVTVLAVEPATGRLKLGLTGKKASAAASAGDLAVGVELGGEGGEPYGGLAAGDIVEAIVKKVGSMLQGPTKDP